MSTESRIHIRTNNIQVKKGYYGYDKYKTVCVNKIPFSEWVSMSERPHILYKQNVLESFVDGMLKTAGAIDFEKEDYYYFDEFERLGHVWCIHDSITINSFWSKMISSLIDGNGCDNKMPNKIEYDETLFDVKVIYTYLMIDHNTGLYKIGRSKSPLKREATLQSEKPTITLIATTKSNIEKKLHKKYENKRVRGEWFSLDENDISDLENNHDFINVVYPS